MNILCKFQIFMYDYVTLGQPVLPDRRDTSKPSGIFLTIGLRYCDQFRFYLLDLYNR